MARRVRPVAIERPLSEPIRRAINRGRVEPVEWELFDTTPRFDVMPMPGGCLFSLGPRRRRRRRWFD